jgi:hypothetical protein
MGKSLATSVHICKRLPLRLRIYIVVREGTEHYNALQIPTRGSPSGQGIARRVVENSRYGDLHIQKEVATDCLESSLVRFSIRNLVFCDKDATNVFLFPSLFLKVGLLRENREQVSHNPK